MGASVKAELAAAMDVLKEALRDRARLHSVIPPAGGPGRRHRQRAGAAAVAEVAAKVAAKVLAFCRRSHRNARGHVPC
jgi:hypothetical protein